MTLWQEILSSKYSDSCFYTSFSELADEFNTTEAAIGKAVKALKRRRAMCLNVEYADGTETKVRPQPFSKKSKLARSRLKRLRRTPCGCK